MEIKKGATGWAEVTPLDIEEFAKVTCEIKRLPFMEMIDWDSKHTDESDGKIKLTFDSPEGREVFKDYVKNIKNLECAGRKIKQPTDLWSDNMPPNDMAHIFMIACAGKWWEMNKSSEDESLDLNEPSVSTGSRAAGKAAKTHSK